MDIFVGNLAETTTADDLRQLFAAYGVIARIHLLPDPDTGQPHGVGLVEMPDAAEAQAAIDGLQGTRLGGADVDDPSDASRRRVVRAAACPPRAWSVGEWR